MMNLLKSLLPKHRKQREFWTQFEDTEIEAYDDNTVTIRLNNFPVNVFAEHHELLKQATDYAKDLNPVSKETILNAYKESIERIKNS